VLDRVRENGLELLSSRFRPGAEPFQRDLVAQLDIDIAANESARTVADAERVVPESAANAGCFRRLPCGMCAG
jgi:hypothetical protein